MILKRAQSELCYRVNWEGKYALVDEDDFERVSQYTWNAILRYGHLYIQHSYAENGKHKSLPLQAFIMNTPEGMVTDHWDDNTLDNRKQNLRVCYHMQNMQNRDKASHNASGFKGVWKIKGWGKYRAQIRVNKKLIHLGYFKTAIEAAKAYNRAAQKYFGEFARLNII